MIAKGAIVFAGMVLASVLATLYALPTAFIAAMLPGSDSLAFAIGLYLVCLAAGGVTSFFLMRKSWPTTFRKEGIVHEPAER